MDRSDATPSNEADANATDPGGTDPDSTDLDPDELAADDPEPADLAPDDLDPGDLDVVDADGLACICDPGDVLDLLARRHAIPVVCAVGALEPARYGDVADALEDASSSTLSTRLDELVDADVLAREQYDEIPPRVEYELTADGRELSAALRPLVQWARERDGATSGSDAP